MDNKLSELSKPVAYDYQIAGACIADGNDKKWVDWNNKITHECPPDWMVEDGKATGIKLLYSQEYVSALLEEIGVRERSLISNCVDYEYDLIEMKRRAEAAEQRVAELEVLLDRNIKRAKKLGELLATPVRLPGALIPAVHASGEPFMRPEPFGFYLNRDDVIKKLRAAGFTVSEE
ncbi:hypothetical protein PTT65_04165 [Serratia ureilytica]|uniref:hypothetical protein n=1 Tax=Serratia ureilytica TaxID=300181 RepID=UPI00313D18A9